MSAKKGRRTRAARSVGELVRIYSAAILAAAKFSFVGKGRSN